MITISEFLKGCAADQRCIAFCRACAGFHFEGGPEPDNHDYGIHAALGRALRRNWGAVLKLSMGEIPDVR